MLNLVYLSVLLFALPWLLWRAIRTGRYRREFAAKYLGRGTYIDDSRPVVWFHGVSVGEIHLLRPVVKAYRERYPDRAVVVSSTTDTGLAEARKHFADLAVIAYPFDFSWSVRRVLRRVRPRLIVLAESELWPNVLRLARQQSVPVAVINGRMSPRSARRFAKIAGLARRLLFRHVNQFNVQTERFAESYRSLGIDPATICVTGSVKYDGVLLEKDNPKTRDLRDRLGLAATDLVWVAGSTHDPEERIVVDVYARLLMRFPNLRLIVVPRSPDRFDEVAAIIAGAGLGCLRRSRPTDKPETVRPVILIDTMGELGAAWGLADVGFTGGSLNKHRGGQSMIEPAGFGVPVVFGPHTFNFRDAVAGLLEVGGAITIRDEAELEENVARLLGDADLRRTMGAAGQRYVQQQQGATQRTLDRLEELWSPR
jgi:3-deoxy-D-manno-octulosonic-acid transferase